MGKKIFDKDRRYSLMKLYTDIFCRSSYRKVEVEGKENIPQDGPVVIAPNHCNSLMDALVVLSSTPEKKVFGARASAFKNPLAAKFLNFARILPMVRKRDGIRNVTKNLEVFETIVDVLENDVKFCMYCEGMHRTKHSLLPIGKGIARVAFRANERFGDKKPVYVIPVGLEYGDYFRFRSTSLLQYGEPINVTEFMEQNADLSESEVYAKFRELLGQRMSKLITYIPDDENYEPKWTLAKIATIGYKGTLVERRDNNNRVIARINELFEQQPEQMAELSVKLQEFEKERIEKKVSFYSLGRRRPVLSVFLKTLLGILLLPYFIYCTVVSLPVWLTAEIIAGGVKDPAFRNTARFGVRYVAVPLTFIAWVVLAFCFLKPWWLALIAIILALPSDGFFYDSCEYVRVLASDWRWLHYRRIRKMFSDIKEEMKKFKIY